MKKRLAALLAAALLLTGCGAGGEQEIDTWEDTEASRSQSETEQTQDAQSDSPVEVFSLEGLNYVNLTSMGNKLLLLSDEGVLTVLDRKQGSVLAELALEEDPEGMVLSATQMGAAYYAQSTRQVVVLNPNLQESARYTLPEEMLGSPLISLEGNEIYYCVDRQIRSLDMQTGISRLVKSQTCADQQLTGCYFDGEVLSCRITDLQGESSRLYLSAKTGQTLSADQGLYALETYQDSYFALRVDGSVPQRIFGTLESEAKSLNVTEGTLVPVLALNGVAAYTAEEAGLSLSFYDLQTGTKTAQVILEDAQDPTAIHADSQYLWVLAPDGDGVQKLYRWDISRSPAQDETVYTGVLYTADNPDTQSLNSCQQRVDTLNSRYGVRIRIWKDAVAAAGEYSMTAEHQAQVINALLDEVEAVLKVYPENFLKKTVKSGWIRICLVRSIDSGEAYAQYWAGGDCCIAITPEADVKEAIVRGISAAVDSHVLSNTRAYDNWDSLNPEGFTYDYDETLDSSQTQYLQGESRAFIDQLSMSYPVEDRCGIFAYAMMEGKEAYFTSPIMQSKLRTICKAVREAYSLTRSTQIFPWEQYLQESIAP